MEPGAEPAEVGGEFEVLGGEKGEEPCKTKRGIVFLVPAMPWGFVHLQFRTCFENRSRRI